MWRPQGRDRFSKADRIRATREFREVMRGGEGASFNGLTLFVRRHPGPGRRLGVAIAGRLSGAVNRNRLKRRLREHFRRHRSHMPQGISLVVVAHRDLSGVDPETFQGLVGELYRRAGLFRHPPTRHAKEIAHSHS